MALTLWLETPGRLAITIPTVAVPIVSWLGVGNLISVLHPVSAEPLIRQWRQRGGRRRTASWLLALALPYALYYVADPMGGVEHRLLWKKVPQLIWPAFGRDTKSFVHLAVAVGVWTAGTVAAVLWVAQARAADQMSRGYRVTGATRFVAQRLGVRVVRCEDGRVRENRSGDTSAQAGFPTGLGQ